MTAHNAVNQLGNWVSVLTLQFFFPAPSGHRHPCAQRFLLMGCLTSGLQVGNIDMLNCYYAHSGEGGSSRLQRRCYWLLEADEDIVLVHYLCTAVVPTPSTRSITTFQGNCQQAAAVQHGEKTCWITPTKSLASVA